MLQRNRTLVTLVISSVKFSQAEKEKKQGSKTYQTTISITTMIIIGHERNLKAFGYLSKCFLLSR